MNLSVLEQMVRKGDMSRSALSYVVDCKTECEWLDYKENLHLESDFGVCSFARDVLGLKNVGGGYLVIGVKDKTWEPAGLAKQLPYDTKLIRDKARRATGLDFELDIVHHELDFAGVPRIFALILVRSSRQRSGRRLPTIPKRDFCSKEDYGIRQGEIYVRRGDSTARIQSAEELADLLDNLEAQADEDAAIALQPPSPFAVEQGTYRLLEKGFNSFIGRERLRELLLEAIMGDPRIWIVNVHGPGGVGKSALVNCATYELFERKEFESVLQLTAKETILTEAGIHKYTGRSLYSLENLLDQILATFEESTDGDTDKKRSVAIEILSAFSMLLVLDNMETVSDSRILSFIQRLPPESRCKVLITSRNKTGGWEFPFPVSELTEEEVAEFIRIKSADLNITFPLDSKIVRSVWEASGGLPLAVQWMLGQYRLTKNVGSVLARVDHRDSPILEFSFRNIWDKLPNDAQSLLCAMTIFDNPPTEQQIAVATSWPADRLERSLSDLQDVTLVTRTVRVPDGQTVFTALPITLTFARNQLERHSDFVSDARQRTSQFDAQMELRDRELHHFHSIFEKYGLDSDNERRAAILCRRAESEAFSGNGDGADAHYQHARDLAPQSAYVLAMYANFERSRTRYGAAMRLADEACKRANKRTGALCHRVQADILQAQGDWVGRARELKRALEFAPDDVVLAHQYGVALSRSGRPEAAVGVFTTIIDAEDRVSPPRDTLLLSLKTRIINLQRLGKHKEAERDMARAYELIEQYPYLASQRGQFDALR